MAQLKVLSYNVNGVRAAIKKGLIDWLKGINADVICLQELKADDGVFDNAAFEALGYQCYTFPATKKGYSGVAILTKVKPDNVVRGCGVKEYDDEGRNIRADFGDLSIMSVYIPSGTTGDERQAVKMKYLDFFYNFIHNLETERPKLLVCGDYNICHTAIDIHNPISNKDTSGFKPEERAWMSKFFDSGFIDTFRFFHPGIKHQYSWWSQRANSRANNKGWRIDYIAASKVLEKNLVNATMHQEAVHSDHCAVELEVKS